MKYFFSDKEMTAVTLAKKIGLENCNAVLQVVRFKPFENYELVISEDESFCLSGIDPETEDRIPLFEAKLYVLASIIS